ncbi:hypothetical protein BURMUCGD1_2982 [Burkholderia multivorans CGD1]|nr:hypothetical protein BURMUCGD1_2982 [Burkholderia multivorans CGD1]
MVVLKRIVAGRPSRDNRVRRPLRTGDDARPTRVRPFGQAGSTSTRQS